jgi:extracellular elastinolytic metalloproteinase
MRTRVAARSGVVLALAASLLMIDAPTRAQELAAAPSGSTSPTPPTTRVDAVAVAREHLAAHGGEHDLTPADVAGLQVSSVVPSTGFTVVHLQQRVGGIDVADAIVSVTVDASGEVAHVGTSAVRAAATRIDRTAPAITDVQAARAAVRALDLDQTGSFRSSDRAVGAERARELGDGGISTDPVPANLVYERTAAGELRLAWRLVISPENGEHWWDARVDATTGRELERHDWVAHADGTYEVFPTPVEAPTFASPAGSRQVLTDPYDGLASPYGWLDVDGVAGADRTTTDGNNVHAYTDLDANNAVDVGSEADGGAELDFRFPLDLTQGPSAYRPAAVTNLFYASNRIHDVLYHHGFDEAAGNFQLNNYGRGGVGGDAVLAETQDGSRVNNANFATPPDGQQPRMQMFVWNLANPDRDSSLDNGIVFHEYGHGVSSRLTGGPAAPGCLHNGEQAGEGWSDFLAYLLTMPAGTTSEPPAGRGVGTYSLNQPTSGPGIRSQRYSRDPAINTMSYDDIKDAFAGDGTVLEHNVGEVWAQMLWQLTWDLVDEHGYDPDLIGGDGGNNLALQLVMDGLKMQPCSPGFVDARDAILAADAVTNGGAHECLIWGSFAADGLGYGARQGSSFRIDDGTEAFDLPPACSGLALTTSTTPEVPVPGRTLTYRVELENTSTDTLTGVRAVSTHDADASYVAGSATCGASYDAGARQVTFTAAALAPGASLSCTYAVAVAPTWSRLTFADDFESGLGRWTVDHVLHPVAGAPAAAGATYVAADWQLAPAAGTDSDQAARALAPDAASDQWLTTADPVTVPAGADLVFDQRNELEPATGEQAYDGGQVLVSDDGGSTWEQPTFTRQGPQHTMVVNTDPAWDSPNAGEPVFSGAGDGWVRSVADLRPYAGRSVLIAFRTVTDWYVGGPGWSVDDVAVGTPVDLDHTVAYSADDTGPWTAATSTRVTEPPAPGAASVTASRALSPSTAEVSFTGADSALPVDGYDVRCTGSDGGAAGSGTGTGSPVVVTGLTAGRTYSCEVRGHSQVGAGPWSAAGPAFVAALVPGAVTVTGAVPVSPTTTRVSFVAPDDHGAPVTSYAVHCVSGDGGAAASGTATTSPATLGGLTPGRAYTCRARATNAAGPGDWGAAGAPYLQAVTPSAPRVRSAKVKGKVVTLVLTPGADGGSPVTRYAVTCRSTTKGRTRSVSGTGPVLKVRALTVGRTYRCRATQTTAAGTSPAGPASTKVTIAKPRKGRR